MLPLQRQNDILDILAKRQVVSVEELCKLLYSSGATIRRDLKKLESEGLIKRTHGGAAFIESATAEFPLVLRESENLQQKDIIAQKALKYVKNGQTIFLDSSSTVFRFAQSLKNFSDITIVTNGIKVLNALADCKNLRLYCTGGLLTPNAKSLIGSSACEFVSRFHADLAFMSCRGVDAEIGPTVSSEEDANIKKAFAVNARRSILLCDASKLDMQFFCKIGSLESFFQLITETELPEKYRVRLGGSR